jgi:hypothetical protein
MPVTPARVRSKTIGREFGFEDRKGSAVKPDFLKDPVSDLGFIEFVGQTLEIVLYLASDKGDRADSNDGQQCHKKGMLDETRSSLPLEPVD